MNGFDLSSWNPHSLSLDVWLRVADRFYYGRGHHERLLGAHLRGGRRGAAKIGEGECVLGVR